MLHQARAAQAIPPASGLASAPRPKIGFRPTLGPSPRERDEKIILTEGHRIDAVEEKAEVHDNRFEGRYEIRLDGPTGVWSASVPTSASPT